MINYDLTEIKQALDKLVIFRASLDEKVIAEKLYDDLSKLGDSLEDALLKFNCQIIDNTAIKEI